MSKQSRKNLRNVNKYKKLSRSKSNSKSNLKKRQFTKKIRGGNQHLITCGNMRHDKIIDPDYLQSKLNCIMKNNIPIHKQGVKRNRFIYEFDKIIILFFMEEPVASDKSDPNKLITHFVDTYITEHLTVKPNDETDFYQFINKHYTKKLSTEVIGELMKNYDIYGNKEQTGPPIPVKTIHRSSSTKQNNNVRPPIPESLLKYLPPRLRASRKQSIQSIQSIHPNKTIDHNWFTNWPDLGVPKMDEFNKFIEVIFADMKKDSDGDGTLIHCSAGVGRTGVVYVVLNLLFQNYKYNQFITSIETEKYDFEDKIFTVVENAKKNRHPWTVQTIDQYIFICNYFGIDKPIRMMDFQNLTTNMGKEQKLDDVTNQCRSTEYNRYGNILPSLSVRLSKLGENKCSNYINASRMIPFEYGDKQFNIFAATCPKSDTFREFYRMLVQENIKRIIMVTGFTENGRLKCDRYIENFHRIDENNQPIKEKGDYLLNTELILDTSDPAQPHLIDLY
jgi:protein tyrosine phosphatase